MTVRPLLTWLALGLLLSLGGCAVGRQKEGRLIDPLAVARIAPGKTTKQEILDLFGPPTRQSRVGAGSSGQEGSPWAGSLGQGGGQNSVTITWDGVVEDIYTYEYRELNENFLSMLLYTYWSQTSLSDTLMVVFDPQEVVKYVAFTKQTDAEYEPPEPEE